MATDPSATPSSPPAPAPAAAGSGGAPTVAAAAPADIQHQITLRYDSQEWPGLIAAPPTLEQIQLLPRYQLGGEIGRGGMGAIIRVVDHALNRPVAMKVMLGARDGAQRQRFVEEAQITGQLEHPGIVPVHDIGTDQRGNPYFTMKLVNGTSLADILRRLADNDQDTLSAFPLPRLLRILVDVCHAVAFAHHRGVIHRDLKPANVMVGRFGEVQVMDWGLAKIADEVPAAAPSAPGAAAASADPARPRLPEQPITSSRDATAHTLYGTIIGTPSYMPPEQASGDSAAITMRSDVYALGALLYEILTLTPPVRGADAFAIIARVLHGHIERPERRAPARAIPGELSAIAMKALRADPRERYPGVAELRADLELFLDGRAVSAKADAPWEALGKLVRRNRAASAAIGIAAALLLAVIIGAFILSEGDRRRAVHSEHLALEAKADALDALAALRKEQAEKERERERRSEIERRALPGLVLQARAAIELDHDDEALRTLDLALAIDAQDSAAQLLRAQIALAQRAWPVAASVLWDYLKGAPGDRDGQQLLDLARRPASAIAAPAREAAIAAVLAHQGATHLATRLAGAFPQQVEILARQLNQRWPGARDLVEATEQHGLVLDARPLKAVIADLSPLHGAPFTHLELGECQRIADLSPLRGMPLTWLSLDQCSLVADLAPLAGMRLSHLNLRNCQRIKDFSVLRGMPLEALELSECTQFTDLALLAGMPLGELSLRSCPHIADYALLVRLPLVRLNLCNSPFADAALLATIPTLRHLSIAESRVKDITPLVRLPLITLELPQDIRLGGLELLRHHPTLTTLNLLPVAEFWKRLDRNRSVPMGW